MLNNKIIFFSELISCHPVSVNVAGEGHKTKKYQHYIELCLSLPSKVNYSGGHEVVKRPRVLCQTEEMSQRASRHVSEKKKLFLLSSINFLSFF